MTNTLLVLTAMMVGVIWWAIERHKQRQRERYWDSIGRL